MPLLATVANVLLDNLLGSAHNAGVPNTLYLGLSTTDPTSSVTEPAVGGYARAAVPNDDATWGPASAGSKSNLVQMLLPEASADYPQVGWFVLFDASTAGNAVLSGALTAPVTVATGRTPRFIPGSLTVTLA